MKIVIWDKYRKTQTKWMKALLVSRGLPESKINDLPNIGFMMMEDEEPKIIAAGFMRWVEGDYGMLDSYISNPTYSSALRNEALDTITSALLKRSFIKGITQLFAFSRYPEIIDRARRHGFDNTPYTFTLLNLTAKDGETCHSSQELSQT